jgi:hypothetical protein
MVRADHGTLVFTDDDQIRLACTDLSGRRPLLGGWTGHTTGRNHVPKDYFIQCVSFHWISTLLEPLSFPYSPGSFASAGITPIIT